MTSFLPFLKKAKKDVVEEFRASRQFTDLLDMNYVVGFEDFRMDAVKRFPEVDFSLQLHQAQYWCYKLYPSDKL